MHVKLARYRYWMLTDRPWWPFRQLHSLRDLLFDPWSGLLTRRGWDRNISPSWGSAVADAFNTAMVAVTPWYRNRRDLLAAIAEENGSKLLDSDRKRVYVRSRSLYGAYVEARSGWFRTTVYAVKYVDYEGRATNQFMNLVGALVAGDGGRVVRTTERRRIVASGFHFTRLQCQRLLDRVVGGTPELDWFDRRTWKWDKSL